MMISMRLCVEIQPRIVTINSGLGGTFFAFIVLGLAVCLCFHIYFWINRKEKVVKKTSPIFGQLILIGIDMVFISQILWEVGQSIPICILKLWFLCLGFGLIMG